MKPYLKNHKVVAQTVILSLGGQTEGIRVQGQPELPSEYEASLGLHEILTLKDLRSGSALKRIFALAEDLS